MTIGRGQPWGDQGPLPADGRLASTDAEAREIVEQARRGGHELPTIGLTGGDLARTLGGGRPAEVLTGPDGARATIDVGAVLIDGRINWFVAHLVVRRGWLRGPIVAVMNAAFLGTWNMAPRAHPNDGRLDVLRAELSMSDRLAARRRLPSGTHVPHPSIRQRRVDALQLDVPNGHRVYLDGRDVGRARQLSIRVEDDALQVVV